MVAGRSPSWVPTTTAAPGSAVSAAGVAYFLWWAVDLVWFSIAFNELSPGLLAIPFWIPRLAMALGAAILLIALLDDLIFVIRGRELPSYEANAETVLPVEDAPAHSQASAP